MIEAGFYLSALAFTFYCCARCEGYFDPVIEADILKDLKLRK